MGSSWRYRHVPITPYSIGDFTGSVVRFSQARLYFFTGLHLASMYKPVNSLVGKKLQACIEVNRKQIGPIGRLHLFKHFPTQVSPHDIQLDPIYYDFLFSIE